MQVQRSTEDPSFFEVIYRGKHTCSREISTNCSSTVTELASRTVGIRDSSTATESASTINDSGFQHPTTLQPLDFKKKNTRNVEWTKQVETMLKTGFDKPPDDGYAWKKYGKREVEGENSRAYYKCTHCKARKQVQRSFRDHSIVDITYRGVHTCLGLSINSRSTSAPKSALSILENGDTTSTAAESASSSLTTARSASTVIENSFGMDSIKKMSGSASIQKWKEVKNDTESRFSPPFLLKSPSSSVTSEADMIISEVLGKSSRNLLSSTKTPEDAKRIPLQAPMARKVKLGDKMTALHQLVSPFGKTDTSSVLSETCHYIKMLQDQVSALRTQYTKQGAPVEPQQQTPKQDLKSQGLCLVPVSSAFPVTNQATVDFSSPTFREPPDEVQPPSLQGHNDEGSFSGITQRIRLARGPGFDPGTCLINRQSVDLPAELHS